VDDDRTDDHPGPHRYDDDGARDDRSIATADDHGAAADDDRSTADDNDDGRVSLIRAERARRPELSHRWARLAF
jgi:hypothetical protein